MEKHFFKNIQNFRFALLNFIHDLLRQCVCIYFHERCVVWKTLSIKFCKGNCSVGWVKSYLIFPNDTDFRIWQKIYNFVGRKIVDCIDPSTQLYLSYRCRSVEKQSQPQWKLKSNVQLDQMPFGNMFGANFL